MAFPACGVDTTAFVSQGAFTKHYGVGEEENVANLFAFYGMLEDAPGAAEPADRRWNWFNMFGFIRQS